MGSHHPTMKADGCEDQSNHPVILSLWKVTKIYLPLILSVGFIGNILILFVISKIKSCFHRLLICLALFDLLFVVLELVAYLTVPWEESFYRLNQPQTILA